MRKPHGMRHPSTSALCIGVFVVVVPIIDCDLAKAQGPSTLERLIQAERRFTQSLGDGDGVFELKSELKLDDLVGIVRDGAAADITNLEQIVKTFTPDRVDSEEYRSFRARITEHLETLRSLKGRARRIVGELPAYKAIDQTAYLVPYQQRLDAAMARANRFMNNSGQQNAARWKAHFQWDELEAAVQGLRGVKKPTRESELHGATLGRVRANFFGFEKGLGSEPFVELREAMGEYIRAFPLATYPAPVVERVLQSRLEQLDGAVLRYEYDYGPSARADVGSHLAYLAKANQATALVKQLRGRYWHPNVYVKVSEEFGGAGLNDVITDTSPVCETLLGTTIRGTAYTQGEFYLALAPSNAGIALGICVNANARAVTTGQRRKVFVHSTGNTSIHASKAMFFSEDGVLTSASPAYAKCSTETNITGVSHRSRLVRKIAYKKAIEYKPTGEQYTNDKAEELARQQVEQQAAPLIKQANDMFRTNVRKPMVGLELFPRWLSLHSTFQDLSGRFLVASDHQMGAPTAPPPMRTNRYAATIQIHESVLSNIGDNLIRGFTLNNENVVELLEKLDREVPAELQSDEKWSLKFADANSVVVRFQDNRIRVGFRGEEFSRGDDEPTEIEIEFWAEYDVEMAPRGVVLHRVGKVRGDVITDRFLDTRSIATRDVITKKFDAVFAKEIKIDSRKLPKPYDRAGDILPAYFSCGYGWASVAINAANVRLK